MTGVSTKLLLVWDAVGLVRFLLSVDEKLQFSAFQWYGCFNCDNKIDEFTVDYFSPGFKWHAVNKQNML